MINYAVARERGVDLVFTETFNCNSLKVWKVRKDQEL